MVDYWDKECRQCKTSHCTTCHKTSHLSIEQQKAVLLANSVRRALMQGMRHFSNDGKPLETATEILETLREEGSIIVLPPNPDQVAG